MRFRKPYGSPILPGFLFDAFVASAACPLSPIPHRRNFYDRYPLTLTSFDRAATKYAEGKYDTQLLHVPENCQEAGGEERAGEVADSQEGTKEQRYALKSWSSSESTLSVAPNGTYEDKMDRCLIRNAVFYHCYAIHIKWFIIIRSHVAVHFRL